ncbi:MAG: hypothetical protein QM808_07285 [Steroidobacteraceae bacterium]
MSESAAGNIVVSKRALNRLADLHHKLSQEMQVLMTQHSRLMGALMACDATTQRTMMLEYRDQLHAVHSVLTRLCVVIDRHGDDAEARIS